MSACERCYLGNVGCRAAEPLTVDGQLIKRATVFCRHFTCEDGLAAAQQVLDSGSNGEPKTLSVAGRQFSVLPFGSEDKPFPEAERYVVSEGSQKGEIVTVNKQGRAFFGKAVRPAE